MAKQGVNIEPADGKLGILLVGLGAVSTTFVAGVEAIRKGKAEPIGSLTQIGTIRLGKRTEKRSPKIKDFVPLAEERYDLAIPRSGLQDSRIQRLLETMTSAAFRRELSSLGYDPRSSGERVAELHP